MISVDQEEIRDILYEMEADPSLVTNSAYRANVDLWPDNRISFVESHMAYLKLHPGLDPSHYLSNLRLMLRKRV